MHFIGIYKLRLKPKNNCVTLPRNAATLCGLPLEPTRCVRCHLWGSSSNGNSQFENEAARACKLPAALFMAGSVVVLDILAVKVRYHAIIGIKHDCVCIVGVKLPRVLSRRGARQHPREFDTNNTHTIMFDPLNNTYGT